MPRRLRLSMAGATKDPTTSLDVRLTSFARVGLNVFLFLLCFYLCCDLWAIHVGARSQLSQ